MRSEHSTKLMVSLSPYNREDKITKRCDYRVLSTGSDGAVLARPEAR